MHGFEARQANFQLSQLSEMLGGGEAFEMVHDDVNFKLWRLAEDIHDNPVLLQNFRELMYQYIGHPDPAQRVGVHHPPGVMRESRRGFRAYGIGCAEMLNPETGELCVVRYDAEQPSNDPTSWLVLQMDLNSETGYLQERAVQSSRWEADNSQASRAVLDLVPLVAHRGPSQLTLQLDENLRAVEPVTLTHRPYYGRSYGPVPNVNTEAEYSVDVGRLSSKIAMTEQLAVAESSNGASDTAHRAQFIGRLSYSLASRSEQETQGLYGMQ